MKKERNENKQFQTTNKFHFNKFSFKFFSYFFCLLKKKKKLLKKKMEENVDYDYMLKLLLIGDSDVGKVFKN